jgi:hypothetical protein
MYNVVVPPDPKLDDLVEKALAAGIPHDSLIGVLTSRGWPENDAWDALAAHYERLTGVTIPSHPGSGATAKDAFFYLLIFSTLATWTIGFGRLAFALIDRWLADPLFSGYPQFFDTYTITWSVAGLLVAFPLYLLISRTVALDALDHPEKLDSPVRKWLTYMALVIAAALFLGVLITALAYLLRGELTSRFLGKSFVVLVLSGGVFTYYFGGLRTAEAPHPSAHRDRIMAAVASFLVAFMVVLGFLQLGTPHTQRAMRADSQRVRDLYQLSSAIADYWRTHAARLPLSLAQLPGGAYADPITHASYAYHPQHGSQYELCAHFARSSRGQEIALGADPWLHAAGYSCVALDASVRPSYPTLYPSD